MIPKTVNILGHDYKVRRASSVKLGKKTTGLMTHPARTIDLLDTLKGESLWLTFLHEIKHAYDFENGDTQILSSQAQEKGCEQFASFITSLQKQGVL